MDKCLQQRKAWAEQGGFIFKVVQLVRGGYVTLRASQSIQENSDSFIKESII